MFDELKLQVGSKKLSPFLSYLKNVYNESNACIKHSSIKKFLKNKFHFINFSHLPTYNIADNDANDYSFDEFHEFYLFAWCILTNRLETAKTFWRLGNVNKNDKNLVIS
jgi:hypothetical protein